MYMPTRGQERGREGRREGGKEGGREGRKEGGREGRRILQQWQCFESSRAGKLSCTQTGHTLQPVSPAAVEDRAPRAGRNRKGTILLTTME